METKSQGGTNSGATNDKVKNTREPRATGFETRFSTGRGEKSAEEALQTPPAPTKKTEEKKP